MNHQTNNLSKLKIHKSHTTHSGGKGEYFHDWYGYLEGFSSEFVKSIINTYMPDAKYILEPFAGVGTTPISLATLGIKCGYSEINPAMRIVIEVKSNVLNLSQNEKKKLSLKIKEIANLIDQKIGNQKEVHDLKDSYKATFKESKYFEDDTFSSILKTRSLIDSIFSEDKLLGQILEVAVMSIIVKCSLLKRAGDVRFKTQKDLDKGIPNYIENLKNQLFQMSNDCLIVPHSISQSSLVANNAKELIDLNALEADGVITSPPYLNGTNYIKNTKLELWFTRHLITDKDLKKFRNEIVTSGINDVQKEKKLHVHKFIKPLYDELTSKTYDKRIPIMVAGYFYDMSIVLEGLAKNTKENSHICIDIGDSIYFDVHVPTHEILVEIAKDHNLTLVDNILLRKRTSHNGGALSQVLLIFENHYKSKNT